MARKISEVNPLVKQLIEQNKIKFASGTKNFTKIYFKTWLTSWYKLNLTNLLVPIKKEVSTQIKTTMTVVLKLRCNLSDSRK